MSKTITLGINSTEPLIIKRFGYGTMQLTGPGIYGEPPNRQEALNILKKTANTGIQFIDTADYYGEDVTNRLIVKALYPYSNNLIICSKVGATRLPDKSWLPFNTPENIRTSIDNNLRTLKLQQMTLVHFRVMPSSSFSFEESMKAMFELQKERKIKHIGVSNVTPEQLELAMNIGTIASVENMYGHAQRTTLKSHYEENRGGEEVLKICELNQIPLIPYSTLTNALPKKDNRVSRIAQKYNVSDVQVNLAWLLHKSDWILPIPGTSSLKHFEENIKSIDINFTKEDMEFLD